VLNHGFGFRYFGYGYPYSSRQQLLAREILAFMRLDMRTVQHPIFTSKSGYPLDISFRAGEINNNSRTRYFIFFHATTPHDMIYQAPSSISLHTRSGGG
jgi:hypothetical protein